MPSNVPVKIVTVRRESQRKKAQALHAGGAVMVATSEIEHIMMVNFVAPDAAFNAVVPDLPQAGDIIVYHDIWYVVRNRKFDLNDPHFPYVYLEYQSEDDKIKKLVNKFT